jgi:glycosyltransferase involved in cell wall biosynthesis
MNVGGPAMQVAGLTRLLPASEFNQRVYAGEVSSDEGDFVRLYGLDLDIHPLAARGRGFSSFSDLRLIDYLAREMRRFRPQIVHSHTAKAGVITRVAAALSGVRPKRVHTFHGHLLTGYFNPLALSGLVRTEKFLAKNTDVLITVGEKVQEELVAAGIGSKRQYRVIPPGVESIEVVGRRQARDLLSISEKDFVVLFLGRLTKIKRVHRLLEAINIASRAVPNIKVLIAGDGELREELQAQAENLNLRASFLGWRNDLGLLLGAADCVAITSDNEGTPVSLIQAAMAGVPAVATDVGSVREVIDHNVSGLVTARTPEAIAESLTRLATDLSLRSRLGEQARAGSLAIYSYGRLVDDHVKLYRDLIPQ